MHDRTSDRPVPFEAETTTRMPTKEEVARDNGLAHRIENVDFNHRLIEIAHPIEAPMDQTRTWLLLTKVLSA